MAVSFRPRTSQRAINIEIRSSTNDYIDPDQGSPRPRVIMLVNNGSSPPCGRQTGGKGENDDRPADVRDDPQPAAANLT